MTQSAAPVNFAYFSTMTEASSGLFVLLEEPDRIPVVVVFGNTGLDWKEYGAHFRDLKFKGEILDSHLLSEAEAETRAGELGLNLEDAKAALKSKYLEAMGSVATVVPSVPSLDERAARFRKTG